MKTAVMVALTLASSVLASAQAAKFDPQEQAGVTTFEQGSGRCQAGEKWDRALRQCVKK